MENTEQKKSKTWPVIIIAFLAVVAILLGFYFGMKSNVEDKATAAEQCDSLAVSIENLVGNYEIRLDRLDSALAMTGYIDTDSLGFTRLHILSEYEPRLLPLEITPDGKVYNEELGEGYMTYKPSVEITTITFQKEDTICVLRRY